jgi:hypothetical protein
MNPLMMMQAIVRLQEIQATEVLSRALREMNIQKFPWYKRPFLRLKIARAYRKAWKAKMADLTARLEQLQKAEPETDAFEITLDSSAN